MIDVSALLKIFPIFAVALIVPGPDFMIVSSISLSRGRLAGVKAAAGIATGIIFYVLLSLWGMAAVLERFLWLAVIVKLLGGVYLIYLGVMLWRASAAHDQGPSPTASKAKTKNPYLAGCLTNLTNPKAVAFFTSVFALTLTPQTSAQSQIALVVMMILMAFGWFSFVAAGLSVPAVRNRYNRARKTIDRIAGSVMILFGAKLVSSAAD